MCRICGRLVKCIFDTMPSRTIFKPSTASFRSVNQRLSPSKRQHRSASTTSLPFRERTISQPRSQTIHTTSVQQATVEPSFSASEQPFPMQSALTSTLQSSSAATITHNINVPESQSSPESKPLVISKSLQTMLEIMRGQKNLYITAHVHSFPYLLTVGDTLRLPFHMHGVNPGDVLRFNRATILGSRDYTLKAGYSSPQHTSPPHVRGEQYINKRRTGEPSYIDERLFECRMTVMGVDSTPLMIVEKKKRRNRRTRRVLSKHRYTVLKVKEIRLKSMEEIVNADGVQVVLE